MNYFSNEDDDGIVTITSPDGELNLTISSYSLEEKIDTDILKDFFETVTENYEKTSDAVIETFGSGFIISGNFVLDNADWVWKIYTKENVALVVSMNGDDRLAEEKIELADSILQSLEVFVR